MLGIMGNIDQQVNDKADSMQMRGKTSTVSKDLLDVMATQKIAREKDTALKELQMAQQQNPNTIKDQLEQKVMGMTQNEMTNQTAGIMAQRAAQKGQPQRPPQQGGIAGARPPMGGAPKPPMPMAGGRPPMGGAPKPPMGGLPAMAGGRPPMMASGGIVGFSEGGSTDPAKKAVLKDSLMQRLKQEREKLAKFPQQPTRDTIGEKIQVQKEIERLQKELKSLDVDPNSLQDTSSTTPGPVVTSAEIARGQEYQKDPMYEKVLSAMSSNQGGPQMTDTTAVLEKIASMDTAITPEQKTAIKSNMASDAVGEDTMGTLGDMAKKDVFGEGGIQDVAQKRFDERYGIADLDKGQDPKTGEMGLKGLQDDLAKEQDRQMSPEVQRAQMLQDMRAGSGLGRRIANASRTQNEKTLEFKQNKIDQYKQRFDTKVAALEKADNQVAKAVELSQNTKVAALQSLANIGAQNAELLLGQTQMYMEQNAERISAALKAAGISEQQNFRLEMKNIDTKNYLLGMLEKIDAERAKEKQKFLESRQVEIDNLDLSKLDDRERYDMIIALANLISGTVAEPTRKLVMAEIGKLYNVNFEESDLSSTNPKTEPDILDGDIDLGEKGEDLVESLKQVTNGYLTRHKKCV